jgi:CheY-like chemotaxis protein
VPYDFEKLSVLVVEDNPPMCNLVAAMFEVYGCKTIDQAYEGGEAYDLFVKHRLIIICLGFCHMHLVLVHNTL